MRFPILFLFIFFLTGNLLKAQEENKLSGDSAANRIEFSKWPYLGERVPRYLALTAGIETMNSHFYFGGLAFNAPPSTFITSKVGAFFGVRIYYKQDMNDKHNYAYEVDVCALGYLAMGLNYNYNSVKGNIVHGFKPFVGMSFFHCQFYYGYCFFQNKKDIFDRLIHHRFTLSTIIPVIGLKKN